MSGEKIIYFNIEKLDEKKSYQLQNLCKRAGLPTNKTKDEMKELLQKYYDTNKKAIEALAAEKENQRKAANRQKRDESAILKERIHYDTFNYTKIDL